MNPRLPTPLLIARDRQPKGVLEGLERESLATLAVHDAAEVLALATGTRPPLVIVDLDAKTFDAWALVRQLKASRHTATIPLVAMTDDRSLASHQRAERAGCIASFPKRGAPHELVRLLTSLLGDHPARKR